MPLTADTETQSKAAVSAVGRLALRPEEAAQTLGVSRSFFFAEILAELRTVRRGRVRLIPVRELERWLERSAARLLD